MQIMDSLAERIRFARTELGMTQDALSKASGVKQSDVSKLERGRSLKTTNLIEIAKALKVSPEWLATGRGSMTPEYDQLIRHDHLREHLSETLGIPEENDEDAVWLASRIDESFAFCEALLCGKQEFTASLARRIESDIGLKIGSLDEYEDFDDKLMDHMRLESSRPESRHGPASELLGAALSREEGEPTAYLSDRAVPTLEHHLKAIGVFLKALDDDGLDFASGVLARFAKSPDNYAHAAAAIQGMINLANGSVAKDRLPKSTSS